MLKLVDMVERDNEVLNQVQGNPEKVNPETYGFISTKMILDRLMLDGWEVHSNQVTKARKASAIGYQKHLVRLRHPTLSPMTSGDQFEIVLLNSHNKDSSLKLMSGIFRAVCANGNILGEFGQTMKVVHSKRFLPKFEEEFHKFVAAIPEVKTKIESLKSKVLDQKQVETLRNKVVEFLFPEAKPDFIDLESIDRVNREADKGNDAWTVGNRIQESLIRGNIRYAIKDSEGNLDHKRSRKIRNINETVKRNAFVWNEIENMLKAA